MERTTGREESYVSKVYAYVTRRDDELLVYETDDRNALQVPRGIVGQNETAREALYRHVVDETGIATIDTVEEIVSDVVRSSAVRNHVRRFFRVKVFETRDSWTHTVPGDRIDETVEYHYSWVSLPVSGYLNLSSDEYVDQL